MKHFFLTILLISSVFVQAQNSFRSIKLIDIAPKKIKAFKAFVNADNSQITHLIQDKKSLYAYLYDKELNYLDKKIYVDKFKPLLESVSGHTSKENELTLYSRKKDKWEYINLDFNSGYVHDDEFDFELKSQVLLNSFTKEDAHYLVTIKKKSSLIFLYKLSSDGSYSMTEYDFSSTDFSGGRRSIGSFFHLIKASSDLFQTDFITDDLPLSLRSTNEKVKLYIDGSKLYITSDNSRDFTYLLELDIIDGTTNATTIRKKEMLERSAYEDSNSFKLDNHLFIIKTTFKEFDFSIVDLSTLDVIKSFSVLAEDEIDFKNTPIYKEAGEDKSILNSTEDFLKKVTNSKPAVCVFKQNGDWIITLGASKLTNGKREAMAVATILLSGGGINARASAESSNDNAIDKTFLDYSRLKSTQFQLVLDSSFNKKEKDIEKNIFDIIKDYDLNKEQNGIKTLYKIDNTYYYNYLNIDSEQIQVIEFKE